jgi:hypothetical protein
VVLMYKRDWRPEALVFGAIALLLLVYNSGYFLPFGGHDPGPRFLILGLPFVGVGLAPAFARLPGPAIALAGVSLTTMLIPTMTGPAVPSDAEAGIWTERLGDGQLQATVLTGLGVDSSWLAWAPVLALLAAALVLAARASWLPRLSRAQIGAGGGALAAWALFAAFGPDLLGIDRAAEKIVALGLPVPHPYGSRPIDTLVLLGAAVGAVALALQALRRSSSARPLGESR